ncbi:MAG: methyltransferase [Alphaproteobacteria bacterium]|nr:methyltransferase [Alphaproteobacteria bacterium]MBU1512790.1 methyltransferase [Alphaproteobacteria bacterium]MBU2093966.1 methyltransferase [Alphaproteobacteria bacterium]MBU2150006.1 methyltransferase [Alphaproteobacteria bacterium]MBU2306453.1 methyltransferase [Alphaproteobacteria bacterium]
MTAILYGSPAPGLTEIPPGATQVSPLVVGSQDLAALADASVDQAVILGPGAVLERDYVLAQALRVLAPGARLLVFAPKDKGGSRLKKALESFGCTVVEDARKHHRFCSVKRPVQLTGVAEAIAAGGPRIVPGLDAWSQPGVFSWDRLDPGSARLIAALPTLSGHGADLGCGVGLLAQKVLTSPAVTSLACLDIDRRAVACAEHNLNDPRATIRWADVRQWDDSLVGLDFVVMNPPFHDGGTEDRDLGVAFVRTAARMLRRGGVCWLVANRHLPYEAALAAAFESATVRDDAGGYKIIEARK